MEKAPPTPQEIEKVLDKGSITRLSISRNTNTKASEAQTNILGDSIKEYMSFQMSGGQYNGFATGKNQ